MYLIQAMGAVRDRVLFYYQAQRDLRQSVLNLCQRRKCIILLDMEQCIVFNYQILVRGRTLEVSVIPNKILVDAFSPCIKCQATIPNRGLMGSDARTRLDASTAPGANEILSSVSHCTTASAFSPPPFPQVTPRS